MIKRAYGGWQRRNSMALHREENNVPLMQSPKWKWRNPRMIEDWTRKIATEGLVWPLREGREIWGADGAFASIRWRREYVRASFRAISQWISVILYGLQTIGTPRGVPKAWKAHAALSEPMTENKQIYCFICSTFLYLVVLWALWASVL